MRRTIGGALTALGVAGLGWLAWSQATRRSLRGRVVLVTGGSRGLGLVLARELLSRGARVAIAGRDPLTLERARDDLAMRGGAVFARVCDVTDRAQCGELIEAVVSHYGSLDVLVNNAGRIEVGPRETMTEDDYRDAMDTHFWGPYRLATAALEHMQRGCQIVNIASIGGVVAVPHLLPYSASKHALVGWSEGLAAELGPRGIAVTTVCPGLVRTGSPRNADFKGDAAKEYAWFIVGDSLPGASVSAEYAASRIANAIERRERHVLIGLNAQVAALAHGIAPGAVAHALEAVASAMPDGTSTLTRRGYESKSAVSEGVLTKLTREAAVRNNEG